MGASGATTLWIIVELLQHWSLQEYLTIFIVCPGSKTLGSRLLNSTWQHSHFLKSTCELSGSNNIRKMNKIKSDIFRFNMTMIIMTMLLYGTLQDTWKKKVELLF